MLWAENTRNQITQIIEKRKKKNPDQKNPYYSL